MSAPAALTPQEWGQLDRVFDDVADLGREQRDAQLKEHFASQPKLLEHALGWSRSLDESESFLNEPVHDSTVTFSLEPGSFIGDWHITGSLGKGGTSEVYRVQRSTDEFRQNGALKLLRNAGLNEHFRRERTLLTSLNHPGIAHFLDGGVTESGQAFTVMEYVDGQSLADFCREEQPSLKQRLEIFLGLCEAVSHAHTRLIIHQDIKPANIRITPQQTPKLLDFGIGQLLGGSESSEQNEALFTPNYAAPEQIHREPPSTATDVYGLGATLHFLLTHHAPWGLESANLVVSLERILGDTRPDLLDERFDTTRPISRKRVAGDLNLIVQKAMARSSDDRYSTVDALAADLRAYLDKKPISLRQQDWLYRSSRLLARKPWQVTSAAIAVLALIGGLILSQQQSRIIAAERDAALRSAERAHAVRSSLFQLLHATQTKEGQAPEGDLFADSINDIRRLHADDPETAAGLLAGFGQIYFINNNYQRAEPLLREALSLVDTGPDLGRKLPEARLDLAQTLFRTGDTDAAAQLLEQSLAVMSEDPDRYRSDLIDSASLQAQLLRANGKVEDAIRVLQKALAQQIQYNGENSTVTALLATNLATNYLYAGQQQQALDVFTQAWRYWMLTGQTDSPDALNQLNNWGLAALRVGEMDTALERLTQAHSTRIKLFGPSGALAALKKNLAEVHWALGAYDAAETMMSDAESMAEEFVGKGSPLHLGIGGYLADLQWDRGFPGHAGETLLRCCAQLESASALMKARTMAIQELVSSTLEQTAPNADTFENILKNLANTGSAGIPIQAFVEEKWAQALANSPSALTHWENAYALRKNSQGEDHWQTLKTQLQFAMALKAQGKIDSAEVQHSQAMNRAIQRYGAESALVQSFARMIELPGRNPGANHAPN